MPVGYHPGNFRVPSLCEHLKVAPVTLDQNLCLLGDPMSGEGGGVSGAILWCLREVCLSESARPSRESGKA